MTDVQPRTDAEIQQDRTGSTSTRRVVLMGAGGIGVAAALAACGTDSSNTNPNGTDFNNNPVPAGSKGTEAGSTGGGNAAAGGTVLVAASEVAVGGGVILDDLVVTQPTEGVFKAFSKLCTHQACPVSKIQDGQIKCTCHNSDFDIATGAPTKGPAKSPLTETQVTLDGDNVVTA